MNVEEEELTIALTMKKDQEYNWVKFVGHTNEMMTNRFGRKLFPLIHYDIEGLQKDILYAMVLEFRHVDDYQYKFSKGECVIDQRRRDGFHIEENRKTKQVVHWHGFKTGKAWEASGVDFGYVKITNNRLNTEDSMVFLHTMRKYVPVFSVCVISPDSTESQTKLTAITVVRLNFAEFIPVTHFCNPTVKMLKMTLNPNVTRPRKRHQPFLTLKVGPENVDNSGISNHSQPKRANLEEPTTKETENLSDDFKSDQFMYPAVNHLPDFSQFSLLQNNIFTPTWNTYPAYSSINPNYSHTTNNLSPTFTNL